MNRQLIYEVPPEFDGKKVFEFLLEACNLSRRFCKAASKEKRLKINGNIVPLGTLVRKLDQVIIIMKQQETQNISPENLELDIVFEDEDLIVLNKPPFILVHPTKNHEIGTLANGLMYHFEKTGSGEIVRFISRLDRDTSGLILIAKNSFAHMKLAKTMEAGKLRKLYLGIIQGILIPREGTIDKPIGKKNESDIFQSIVSEGQPSRTKYRTIETVGEYSLIEFELITGRTHQIRVHLQSEGFPLVGDALYGGMVKQGSIERQALHAYKLTFNHPRTGLPMLFEIPMPRDMNRLLERE